jgi:hypothetical protein
LHSAESPIKLFLNSALCHISRSFFAQRAVNKTIFLLLEQPLNRQYSRKRIIDDLAFNGSKIKIKIGDFRSRISPRIRIYIRETTLAHALRAQEYCFDEKKTEAENLGRLPLSEAVWNAP